MQGRLGDLQQALISNPWWGGHAFLIPPEALRLSVWLDPFFNLKKCVVASRL
jgi:hypothetical protein